ncbi:hypothetical protein [Streptococcus infantarius]|uniref:hypothetical protein n=1 Tax=Streptococcus infantarius TaxID=102684 RepID=UPI003D1378F1
MNELEINILNYIKNHGSFERPVTLRLLKAEFNISERSVKEVVERLRSTMLKKLILENSKFLFVNLKKLKS